MSTATNSRRPRILIGVTGSVDAILVPAQIRAIKSAIDCSISVILTPDALSFVNPDGISLITERVIHGESPEDWATDRPGMIAAAHDLMIVLPATANTLSAAAAGSSMNRLTMMFLVGDFPIVFFPVMGPSMWDRPVVRRNVALIREDGHEVMEPTWREQFEPRYGRMVGHYTLPEPAAVIAVIRRKLGIEAAPTIAA